MKRTMIEVHRFFRPAYIDHLKADVLQQRLDDGFGSAVVPGDEGG